MEAPNQIKFQSPIMPQRPVVTPDGQTFRTLFDSVQQKQTGTMDYQPPSPKTGVAWLEVKSQTPYKDIQQQLASSKQPTLLKFKQLDHHFTGLKPILTTAQQQKQLQHLIIRQSRFQHDQVAMVARVLQLNDGIAWLVLDHNDFDDADIDQLMTAVPEESNIKHLVLTNNNITDHGLDHIIAALPKMPKLETVWLADNQLTQSGLDRLNKAIKNHSSIKTVDV